MFICYDCGKKKQAWWRVEGLSNTIECSTCRDKREHREKMERLLEKIVAKK